MTTEIVDVRAEEKAAREKALVELAKQLEVCKPCKGCQKLFDNKGDQWKTHCFDCYMTQRRQCTTCDGFLRLDAKPFAKTCGKCYVKKMQKTHGTCPFCPKERATHLRRPLMDPACPECIQNAKFFLKRPMPEEKEEEDDVSEPPLKKQTSENFVENVPDLS